jgi:integrase
MGEPLSFRESLDMVRGKAGMPNFGFHDLRHHFISMCVMSGIDFMTIAAWVGHKDGGVLIGRVYGHLANEHRKAMGCHAHLLQPAGEADYRRATDGVCLAI